MCSSSLSSILPLVRHSLFPGSGFSISLIALLLLILHEEASPLGFALKSNVQLSARDCQKFQEQVTVLLLIILHFPRKYFVFPQKLEDSFKCGTTVLSYSNYSLQLTRQRKHYTLLTHCFMWMPCHTQQKE